MKSNTTILLLLFSIILFSSLVNAENPANQELNKETCEHCRYFYELIKSFMKQHFPNGAAQSLAIQSCLKESEPFKSRCIDLANHIPDIQYRLEKGQKAEQACLELSYCH
ncbi:hypothetical protein CYY_001671 [Polysphondylium violaceum]|uniref:Saposin B-type domain-containing protein n=1 Tax=Polysphondylium violaceum TaxID=133409 RepID=A0A8J4VAE2_9MYCE|nr:hypothetical protein CYY_001671 [Polysphondylium violaceum]